MKRLLNLFLTSTGLGIVATAIVVLQLQGCFVGKLAGGMTQNFEYQKQIEVTPEYIDLQNRTVAVVVNADLSTLYEYPDLVANFAGGISGRLAERVPGSKVTDPRICVEWQLRTPNWDTMPFSELAEQLGADRVVYIDIYEYRHNPPGNRWLWEGVCIANISVIEKESPDADIFAETFTVSVSFPKIAGLARTEATESQIMTGLRAEFIKETSWLFYTHLEPKHPDKFRPEFADG